MKYALISKYRTTLMGFATLWVALLHAQMWFRNPILEAIKVTGHNGVDIFLFLSGFGLYYAYQKTQGFAFIAKRFLRILPVFIPVALARIIYYHYDGTSAFYLLTTLAFWFTYDRSMWYISMILVLYLLTPLYMRYCFQGREKKCTMIAIPVTFLLSFFFFDHHQLLFFGRLPIFLLGIYFGYQSYQGAQITKKQQTIGLLIMILAIAIQLYLKAIDVEDAIMFGKGGYWYCAFFIVVPLCYLLASFFGWLEKKNVLFINQFFDKFGKVSLAFYLLHEICIRYFTAIMNVIPPYNYNGILLNVIIIILTYLMAYILQNCVNVVLRYLLKENA